MNAIQIHEPECGWLAHYRRKAFLDAVKDAVLGACLVVLFVLYIFAEVAV